MDNEISAGWADPSVIPEAVRENVRLFGESHGEHDHPVEIVRSATHHGHRIVVRTRYSVEVDGRPLDGHLAVTDDGSVHYHTLPNYSFGSALDLVKQVIDSFPDDFDGPEEGAAPPPHHAEHAGPAEGRTPSPTPSTPAQPRAAHPLPTTNTAAEMGVRRNITADPAVRDNFLDGVRRLKREQLGITAANLGISADTTPISTYDLFVVWHHLAMNVFTPPDQQDRNAAHRGPVFLPSHRFMLIVFELQLQRVLDEASFGLPYWDWAADGDLPPTEQPAAPVWADDCLGGDGSPITRGPFAFDPADEASWRVRVEVSPAGRLRLANRGPRRSFGRDVAGLPRGADVTAALDQEIYDTPPWNTTSAGFRNQLEGWQRSGPRLHNQVHVWIGGDMSPSSSPNDPAFYLNHCNVDRIWAGWQQQNRDYLPDQTESNALFRHRIDDPMFALLTRPLTPRQTLDVAARYSYDELPQ